MQLSEAEKLVVLLRDVGQQVAQSEEENRDAAVAIEMLTKLIDYVTALAQHDASLTVLGETVPLVRS